MQSRVLLIKDLLECINKSYEGGERGTKREIRQLMTTFIVILLANVFSSFIKA